MPPSRSNVRAIGPDPPEATSSASKALLLSFPAEQTQRNPHLIQSAWPRCFHGPSMSLDSFMEMSAPGGEVWIETDRERAGHSLSKAYFWERIFLPVQPGRRQLRTSLIDQSTDFWQGLISRPPHFGLVVEQPSQQRAEHEKNEKTRDGYPSLTHPSRNEFPSAQLHLR